jgi:hypothetical protein
VVLLGEKVDLNRQPNGGGGREGERDRKKEREREGVTILQYKQQK